MNHAGLDQLTDAERECLRLLWLHRTQEAVAALRGKSIATIRKQLGAARTKLRVGSSMEAARAVAIADGLIDTHPLGTQENAIDFRMFVRDPHWQAGVAEGMPWPGGETEPRTDLRVQLSWPERLAAIGRHARTLVSVIAMVLLIAYLLQWMVSAR